MIWNKAMKYPVLMVGIIFFGIFISSPKTKEFLKKYSQSRVPNTCLAVLNRVSKKAPKGWELECPKEWLLQISIKHQSKKTNLLSVRPEMYKALANYHVLLMQLSNLETLHHLGMVEFKLIHPELTVISQTEGSSVARMSKINLKNPKHIAFHLKTTVNTKEIRK